MRIKIISVLVLFGLLITLSCKKEKLDGEFKPLIGEWDWVYTTYAVSVFQKDTITPNSEGFTSSIIFKEKGVIVLNENGEKVFRSKIIQDEARALNDGSKMIVIDIQRWGKGLMALNVFGNHLDSLSCMSFPVVEYNGIFSDGDGVSEFRHYYRKR